MEEKQLDYTGAEVQEIVIDQAFAEEQAKKKRVKEIVDKITTGLFIALLASPLAILLYIFLWFVSECFFFITYPYNFCLTITLTNVNH